jgi:uncharacterized protein YueI
MVIGFAQRLAQQLLLLNVHVPYQLRRHLIAFALQCNLSMQIVMMQLQI